MTRDTIQSDENETKSIDSMGRNHWFEFKQFRIEQKETAMKVGTDGVIIGAWVSVDNAQRILDVGTGTGLIALMLAQRGEAVIDAVEIEEAAYREAGLNLGRSEWKDRLRVYHTDFQSFTANRNRQYDVIVSNPPFFIDSLKTPDPKLAAARHNVSLSFVQLIEGAKKLLKDNGRLNVILPFEILDDFRESARMDGFYLKHRTDVKTKPGRQPMRVLLEFSLSPVYPETDEIMIRNDEGEFTDEFKKLTAPYYLNF